MVREAGLEYQNEEFGIFSSTQKIIKYSKYKIHEEYDEDQTSTLFIVPDENAIIENNSFSVFDLYPDIFQSFIRMAQKIKLRDKEESAYHILNFCNKYGLFNTSGLYAESFILSMQEIKGDKEPSVFDDFWVKLSEVGFDSIGSGDNEGTLTIREYADIFFPKSLKIFNDIKSDIAKLNKALFHNYFSEPIHLVLSEIVNLYSKISLWQEFYNNDDHDISQDFLSDKLITNNIKVTVDLNGNWHYKWDTSNLIDALHVMFLMNIVESKKKLQICQNEYCNAPFLAGNINKKHCSPSCTNAAKQRRHYHAQKKKGNGIKGSP